MGERSLVAFTLLVQTACGALVGLAGVQLLGSSDVLGSLSFVVLGLLLLVAAVASTLHLGAPRHALYAARNLRESWLSREIVCLGLVGGLVALGAAVAVFADPEATRATRALIGVFAAAAGAALLLTMVRVYTVRTIPEWQTFPTSARFAGSTLRLGAIVAGILVALAAAAAEHAGGMAIAWLAALWVLGLGLRAVVGGRARPAAGVRPGALLVRADEAAIEHPLGRWFMAGALVSGAGLVALALNVPPLAVVLLVVGTVMLGFGEVRLRERFYESAPRQGRDTMRPPAARASVSGQR